MADADFNVKAIISAQTSQFEKGMKNAQSSVNSLSSSISNITSLVKKAFAFTGITIGTKAIIDFTKSCVQGANQSVKTFNILDNTVKATGADAWTSIEKLEEASKSLSDQTNYSVTEIQKMQSVLLGFTNITGEAFDGASEAVLDMATVMGMDLTSAVQTIGKALDDPITGLDSLRRQGFKFTDEQKEELAQLVKNGKQYEAQKIILDTLATSYGGASKAGQDSFAKQRHAVENFKDALGTKLIPVMQVFAADNTKMINSLRELIENMDFTPVINVITNLKKIFAEVFNTISGYIRNIGAYVSDLISRFNFKPIISILDTLIGFLAGVISKFKEINSQKLEIFDKLKESLVDFSNSETFQNIVNFVNKIIDAVFFLWSEIQDIGEEIRQMIVDGIIKIWNKIKEFFQNSQNALSQSGQDIASWGDLFYDILNNAFRIFQDFFGMIKALIHGDWSVAWEYAKLTVMRVADSILDLISTVVNAFPNMINGMIDGINVLISGINKVRGWLGKDPLGLISAFKSVDLSKETGLEDKIKETENKIQELTGKSADVTIQNLEGVSTKFAGFTQHALGEIGKLTEGVATNSEKQKQYFTGTLSSSEDDVKSIYEKLSEWDSKLLQQRLDDLKEWSKKYHKTQLQLIEAERKKALKDADTESERAKVNAYYDNEIKKENERMLTANVTAAKEAAQKISGITKQSADRIKTIMSGIIKFVSAGIQGVSNIIKKTFDILSRLSSSVFSKVKSGLSTLFKIDLSDTIDSLLEFEDAILTFFVETLPQLPALLNTVFSSIHQTLGSVNLDVNAIVKILKTALDTFISYAPAIVNDVLRLLASFFEGLDSFVARNGYELIQSIGAMAIQIANAVPGIIETISHTLDILIRLADNYLQDNKNTLLSTLSSLADALTSSVPSIFNSFINIAGRIVELIIQTLRNKTDDVVGAVGSIVSNLFSLMSSLLPQILELAGKFIVSIASYISGNAQGIQSGVQTLITSIMTTIQDFISGGGIATVLDGVLKIVELVCNIVTGNATEIANQFVEVLPAIFEALKKALPEIIRALKSVLGPMIKMTFSLIVEIMELLLNHDMLDSIIELVVELVHQILTEFVPAFMRLLPKIIPALIEVFAKSIPELVWGIVSGLVQGLINTNWVQLAKDIWKGFIDSFKSLFGIHSPSTLFADFGVNIIQGLWNGMKSMGTWLCDNCKSFFNTMVESIKGVFSDIGSWFKSTFTTAYNNMTSAFANAKTWFSNLFSNISSASKSFASSLKENMSGAATSIKNTASSAFSSVVSGVKSLGSKVASFFGFANGTNSAPRGLALVGEAGPELVRFRGGEQVINNKNTQKLLADSSNGSNIFNVTFNNTVDTTAYAMIRELQSYQRNLAFNGVL